MQHSPPPIKFSQSLLCNTPSNSHSSGEAPAAPTIDGDQDQDEADADLLGLPTDRPTKARRLSGPKVKKSREEVFAEETEKLVCKWAELMDSMHDSVPTVATCAKHLRSVNSKLEEARNAGSFETVTGLESLAGKVSLVKEALRVSNLYITANGSVKKNQEASFVNGMSQLPAGLLQKFPPAIVGRYHLLVHAKDSACRFHGGRGSSPRQTYHFQMLRYINCSSWYHLVESLRDQNRPHPTIGQRKEAGLLGPTESRLGFKLAVD